MEVKIVFSYILRGEDRYSYSFTATNALTGSVMMKRDNVLYEPQTKITKTNPIKGMSDAIRMFVKYTLRLPIGTKWKIRCLNEGCNQIKPVYSKPQPIEVERCYEVVNVEGCWSVVKRDYKLYTKEQAVKILLEKIEGK